MTNFWKDTKKPCGNCLSKTRCQWKNAKNECLYGQSLMTQTENGYCRDCEPFSEMPKKERVIYT